MSLHPYCPIPTPAGYDVEKVQLAHLPTLDKWALNVKWQVVGGAPVWASVIIEPSQVADVKLWEDMLIQVRIYVRSRGQPDHKPNSILRNGTELLSDNPPPDDTGVSYHDAKDTGGTIRSFRAVPRQGGRPGEYDLEPIEATVPGGSPDVGGRVPVPGPRSE